MAKEDPEYHPIVLRRGETKSVSYTYRPRDKTLPPHNITGKVAMMKIKAKGIPEITYVAPYVMVTDGPNGVITRALPGADVTAFAFQNADYAMLLDGERLFYGDLTIVGSIYE